MNGIHDLGGMHGIGAVDIQPDEPTFAADWERRAFGCNMLFVISGIYSIDESRHAMEKFPPAHYLETSYYEHWLQSYEALLIEKGLLTQAEIEAGTADPATIGKDYGTFKAPRDMIAPIVASSMPVLKPDEEAPLFDVGQKVRARNLNPKTHTRLPRYVRGRVGHIVRRVGTIAFSDTRAHGLGDQPQHVYSVRFEGVELWGPDAGPRDAVYIDLYQSYLEPL